MGLSSCSSWALECGLSGRDAWAQLLHATWNHSTRRIEPVSPASTAGFSTRGPPGKSYHCLFGCQCLPTFPSSSSCLSLPTGSLIYTQGCTCISVCVAGSCISISSPSFLPSLQIYLPLCFLDIGLPYCPLTLSVSKTEINFLSLKILLFPVSPLLINGRLSFTQTWNTPNRKHCQFLVHSPGHCQVNDSAS